MIKTFCDNCEDELTAQNPNVIQPRLKFKVKAFTFEVIISMHSSANDGHLCEKCAKKLFQKAEVIKT